MNPESVVVVANQSVPGSVEIARRYIEIRAIPENHLVVLQATDTETLSREAFLETIRNPLLEQLVQRDLINAILGEKDSLGRRTAIVVANPIQYLVLCYGVPTTVSGKPVEELDDLDLRERRFTGNKSVYGASFGTGPLAKNTASVDGELSMLLKRDVPLNGFVLNPCFKTADPGTVRDILRVTRLDGSTPEAVFKLLANTLIAEKNGLKGRAYVDLDGRGAGYQLGNDWLTRVSVIFNQLGFETDKNTEPATFREDSRFDAPAFYAGWYASHAEGPFKLPGFRFPPGAVAVHLHSFSARPVHSVNLAWVGPLVERGACVTLGNVDEPYLKFTHHLDLFFASIADGWNVVDAAYFALPVLSWQAIVIGDPFYRPLAVPLETQLAAVGRLAEASADPYVYLRKVKQLRDAGDSSAALKMARRGMFACPGPALAVTLSGLLEESGDTGKARDILQMFRNVSSLEADEWGLYAQIADALVRLGDARNAFRIYQGLEKLQMPDSARLAFLERGIQSAVEAGETETAAFWESQVHPLPPEPRHQPADPPE